jgi:ATP-dependent Clp protease ATP-binding subunit ClpA
MHAHIALMNLATHGKAWADRLERARKDFVFRPLRVGLLPEVHKICAQSWDDAWRMGHTRIEAGHLMSALLREGNRAVRLLRRLGHDPDAIRAEIEARLGPGENASAEPVVAESVRPALEAACEEGRRAGVRNAGVEHLLLALLEREPMCGLGLDVEALRQALSEDREGHLGPASAPAATATVLPDGREPGARGR